MKKFALTLLVLSFGLTAFSQIPPNTLGLRLGGGFGFDWEASYQRACSENRRLEMGLGMGINSGYNGLNVSSAYQWVWNINSGFNWFAGPGAQIGSRAGDFYMGFLGQVGVEYLFSEIPIQVAIDTRPTVGVVNAANGFEINVNFAIRYVFGE